MRMWMINPKLLCRQHLLGEHSELHKHLPMFKKRFKVTKRIEPVVQIELSSYQARHDTLAAQLLERKYNHASPLSAPDISYLPEAHQTARVDLSHSIIDLCHRCPACRARIMQL